MYKRKRQLFYMKASGTGLSIDRNRPDRGWKEVWRSNFPPTLPVRFMKGCMFHERGVHRERGPDGPIAILTKM